MERRINKNRGELESIIATAREEFFSRRNWQRKQCQSCLSEYYAKQETFSCGSYECVSKYAFLDIAAPKAYLEFNKCAESLRKFFSSSECSLHSPLEVVRDGERTLFASTAGQIYDTLIYGKLEGVDARRHIVLQPVVRLQGIDSIASIDGISTSFVHAATESWNIQPMEHFAILDKWLDFLSGLGLYAGGLCLKTERADNDWDGRIVTSEIIRMNYSGLEIGVANFFFNIPQLPGTTASLSDIGVGLERLVWAINKSPSYLDSVGPLSSVLLHKRGLLDAIRTAVLIAGSGTMPGNSNQGYKLRTMIKIIREESRTVNLYELVAYYYGEWSFFIDLPVSKEQTYAVITREIDRGLNLEISRVFGIEGFSEQGHETFLREAVQRKVVSIKQLWETKKEQTMKTHQHIFLGGGGQAEDSRLLDERFVAMLDHSKPLVYIPNAMKSTPDASCLEWFQSVMKPLGIKNIEMWDDLHPHSGIEDIAGLYLGGGDTGKLLEEIRQAAFGGYLCDAVEGGVPVYGGSAGAIVLGEDIRTAPEAKKLSATDATGLKIVRKTSIVCHYKPRNKKAAKALVDMLNTSILAIPEKSGGYLKGDVLTNYGTEPIFVFSKGEDLQLNPGEKMRFF